MSLRVIEGTWEEIERRKAELVGHQLRVTIKPSPREAHNSREVAATVQNRPSPRVLLGMGAFKGMTAGSEAFAREKQEDLDREERGY